MFADGFQRGKADGPGLAGFEDGQVLRGDVHAVGQIVQAHFALGKNHVEIDDDGHIKRKEECRMQNEETGLRASACLFLHSSFVILPLGFRPSIPVPPAIPALLLKATRQKSMSKRKINCRIPKSFSLENTAF